MKAILGGNLRDLTTDNLGRAVGNDFVEPKPLRRQVLDVLEQDNWVLVAGFAAVSPRIKRLVTREAEPAGCAVNSLDFDAGKVVGGAGCTIRGKVLWVVLVRATLVRLGARSGFRFDRII